MNAKEAKLLGFLKKSPQFEIPIYQRTYSWTKPECSQLWDDILRTGADDDISSHFLGSIVYIEKGLYSISNHSPLLVIDGQQRLTTVMLIIEALARQLGDQEPLDGFSAKKLRNYYLLNPLEEEERRYKLVLTKTDKQSLLSIVDQKALPAEESLRVVENFNFFLKQVKALGTDLRPLCLGLAKLMVVDISLSRNEDNPQLIFESMNSTGRELSQADLIRNFILMSLELGHQTELYNDHWRPMEVAFGQEAYDWHFDGFMRHFLTVKTGEIPKLREVYVAFKAYAQSPEVTADGVDALVADVHEFAKYYCAMALGREQNPALSRAFKDLQELKVEVAYPLLLELYHCYAGEELSAEDFECAVRLVESYVFRRAVCNIPTSSLNKTFGTFGRVLQQGNYLENIQAHFQLLPSYRRFPNDDEFLREIQVRDLYNFRSKSYWLRRMENYNRKEIAQLDEYTIEHIMPQNENLSSDWRNALGDDWKTVQETWLHRLGNLTLTGYNPELSDRPFAQKRDMEGGFKDSPLRMNRDLDSLDTWDEAAIRKRSGDLARKAVTIWLAPTLVEDVLVKYRPVANQKAGYSIDTHRHLAETAAMRSVFDVLRHEILALDDCVSETFLKLYVAYKAETNFVDVVPQAKRLSLSLNMPFHELRDPKGFANDVTNMGRWGNGDVEVGLRDVADMPYVMSLVRQAYDHQMGAVEVEA